MESDSPIDYLLGSTDAEHERLIRQAIRLASVTDGLVIAEGTAMSQRGQGYRRFSVAFS